MERDHIMCTTNKQIFGHTRNIALILGERQMNIKDFFPKYLYYIILLLRNINGYGVDKIPGSEKPVSNILSPIQIRSIMKIGFNRAVVLNSMACSIKSSENGNIPVKWSDISIKVVDPCLLE